MSGERRSTLLLLGLPGLVVLAGFGAWLWSQRGPAPQRAQYLVFGSTTTVELRGVEQTRAAPILAEIGQLLQQDQREWHPWEISDLMRLNAAIAEGGTYQAPPALAGLIRRSKDVFISSKGLFDPALGKLIGLWGYHTSEFPLSTPMPEMEQVQHLLKQRPGMDDVDITDDDTVSVRRPGVELDLNGLAEGYAEEQIAALLRKHGVADALINVGGDVLALGRAGERAWHVGIESPDHGVLAGVDLGTREALFTSGNYSKYREVNGQRWAHILDPRTGMPIHGTAATSVIHPDAVVADAAATALMIAGAQEFAAISRSMGVSCALLLTDTGELHVTPAMQRRLRFPDAPPKMTVSEDLGADCAALAKPGAATAR